MIVDPDFPDHWRTRYLCDLLGGDEAAGIYVLRLWAHCQNRKQTQFKPMPNRGLRALCKFPGDADLLANSLVEAGFIRISDSHEVEIIGWADHNAQLVAAWENGRKGGRPKKPTGNPQVTQGEPDRKRSEQSRAEQSALRSASSMAERKQSAERVPGADAPCSRPAIKEISADELAPIVDRLFRDSGYAGQDGSIFWKAAALYEAGLISAADMATACEQASAGTKSKPALFRSVLARIVAERGKDLKELLETVKITPRLPKTAPTLEDVS